MSGTTPPICAGILSVFWLLVWLFCWHAYLVIMNSTIAKKINYLGQKTEHVHINPMRKFNETRVRTRTLGPRLLGRGYFYRGERSLQYFRIPHYNISNFFPRCANTREKALNFYIWYILITSRMSIGLPYNKGDTFKIKMSFQKYEIHCGHKKKKKASLRFICLID